MSARPPRPVEVSGPVRGEVVLPPSKSYTNRALIAAALAEGPTLLDNVSRSQDSRYMTGALVSLGVALAAEDATVALRGSGGVLTAPRKPLFVGNAGTTFRFLTAAASLARGEVTITGDEQMRTRPIGALCDALAMAGVQVTPSASMSVASKQSTASFGVSTMGLPARLNEVSRITGTPVSSWKASTTARRNMGNCWMCWWPSTDSPRDTPRAK